MARATGARVATPAPPVPKSGDVASPGRAIKTSGPAARDPRFLRVVAQVQRTAVAHKKHAPAARKAAEAQAAAVPPANERSAGAKADQVDAMQDAKPGSPKTTGFLALLRAEIEKVMPKTLDDTEHFMAGGAKDQVKAAVGGNVQQSKDAATGPVEQAATAAPDPAAIPARKPEAAPGDAHTPAATIHAQGAVPPPKPAAEVSQQKYTDTADAQFKAANVTDTQLQKANDPRFSATLGAKKGLQAKVAAAPGQYRGAEHRVAAVGIAHAAADGRTQLVGMAGQRERQAASVKSRQQLTKERDEQRRKTVTDKIEGLYQKTRVSVELGLSTLETDVMAAFDGGMNTALADLQTWTAAEIQKFKDQRYDGLAGKARWIADLFRPVPPEIKQILAQGKTRFTAAMDVVAVKVAGIVDTRLASAKSEIKKGQAEIAGYVASLPADLKAVGKAAEGELQARFQALEDGIDAKKQALAESLANKYKEASEKGDAELQKVEAANAGALKGLTDQLGGVFKIISEFKDKLVGILRKGQETINLILADPIGFLGNLISAVKGGLNAFVGNLKSWLLKGLASWLFGSLAETGITMPADLSLGSIFKLVMELLGISYAKIRGKAVKLVGEPVVKTVETMAEFAKVFITGGPAALWAHIKEQLADLKSMVLDAIIAWVTETIVVQAVSKIVSMCNPAGAFVQACIAIYNVVMFLVERAKQLIAFVDSIVNSVHNIATGNIGGAVSWIEQALGRAVPIVISFFARLIGLGGITAKIVSIVKMVQGKVDKALDVVLGTVIGGIKKVATKLGTAQAGSPQAPKDRLRLGMQAALLTARQHSETRLNETVINQRLVTIKAKYGFRILEATRKGNKWWVRGVINPDNEQPYAETSDDEASLLDDGTLTLDQRKSLLSKVRGIVKNDAVITYFLNKIKDKRLNSKNAVKMLNKIIELNLTEGYRLEGKERKDIRGLMRYEMNYMGIADEGGAVKIAQVKRGGTEPIGWAYVKVQPTDPDGSTLIRALALDFLVSPGIEMAGIKGVGSKMFNMSADYYSTREPFVGVIGEWYTLTGYSHRGTKRPAMSQNLTSYIAERRLNVPPVQAVMVTWTYKRVKKLYGDRPLTVVVNEFYSDWDKLPQDEKIVEILIRPT